MPLPERIQIGPCTYTTKESDDFDSWGRIDHMKSTITLKAELSMQEKRVATLEEIGHAMFLHLGLDFTYKSEAQDQILRGFSYLLLDTLKRNPDLVGFLLEE